MRRRRSAPLQGLVVGLIAGLAGTFVMTRFQGLWQKLGGMVEQDDQGTQRQQADQQQGSDHSEDATMKAADKLSRALLRRPLTYEQKKKAGPFVHYGFGTINGGIYGAAGELAPQVRAGYGTAFGTAVFIGADEIAVPALGLSQPPTKAPLSSHAYGLAAHLVYGVTTELLRRTLRRTLRRAI